MLHRIANPYQLRGRTSHPCLIVPSLSTSRHVLLAAEMEQVLLVPVDGSLLSLRMDIVCTEPPSALQSCLTGGTNMGTDVNSTTDGYEPSRTLIPPDPMVTKGGYGLTMGGFVFLRKTYHEPALHISVCRLHG